MIRKLSIENNEYNLFRGMIPIYLMNNINKRIVYISSSNKNLEDYYFVIRDFYDKSIIKIDNINIGKEEINGNKQKVLEIAKKSEFIILMSVGGAIDNYFNNIKIKEIAQDNKLNIKDLVSFFEENGFVRNYLIEKKGDYSVRGDIVDIFPVDRDYPIRIEFFDNVIESIRYFDIDTQRSIDKLEKITIYSNKNDNEDNIRSILEIFDNNEVLFILENVELCNYKLEEYILLDRKNENIYRKRYESIFLKSKKVELKNSNSLKFDSFKDYEYVKEYSKNKKVYILSEEESRYINIFSENQIEIYKYPYFEGFETENYLLLTDRELKGIRIKRAEKRKEGLRLNNISQILKGDYLIHKNYGVGMFLGIEEVNGKEYISIKYADSDKLYVPLEHINFVEKYIFEPGKVPEIYKLGTAGFKKKREKLREEIIAFAKELIKIQAKRNLMNGFKFSQDTVWQEEFEEAFPYKETPGQLNAIYDVKNDMESYKPMDRVICGDVGFGKTEVALRAVFKATIDSKQVAFLAPTTVLVNQHFERIKERFKNFPIRVEMISRIVSLKKQRIILEELNNGLIDIIVGTHRLVQNDIKFKNLGLLVIDEEQKFGVKDKEKIKNMKNNVDVLSLTATPIPRTLNLAFLGIKDLSIIDTPPENRLSIETFFINNDEKMVREAILKEIARDGQVFYLYNNVNSIEYKLKKLREILPEYIKISYIHGQMDVYEIRSRMNDFENRNYDILITTTIIENGIDIENVNTMIVEDYDKLGLSQIYQLRGRIGRGNRKAYCYLLLNEDRKPTKKGKEKIEVIKEMKDLGAGFQLSLEDMRIRGTGELLGEKQHGILEELGYDMYIKMLDEEMNKLKGKDIIVNKEEIVVDLKLKGFIPDSYINESEKLNIYRKLISKNSEDEIDEFKDEIIDRFGKMPIEVINLFNLAKIRILALLKNITFIKEDENGYLIKFAENKVEIDSINMLLLEGLIKYRQKENGIYLERKDMKIKEFLKDKI